MKNLYIILMVFLLSACSAEWHLHRAIKKNPKYGDSTKVTQIIIVHDTIRDTILIPEHKFSFTIDSLRNALDVYNMVYNDSFLTIYGKLDSLGKIKFTGTVKEKKVPFEVIIHDTIKVETKCPQNITVVEGYPKWYFWVLIGIFALILILLIKK